MVSVLDGVATIMAVTVFGAVEAGKDQWERASTHVQLARH
jgi:hypothetical protein